MEYNYSFGPNPELFVVWDSLTMGQSFTLGKDQRCKSRKLIERIFKEGKAFSLFPFRVFYLFPAAPGPASAPSSTTPSTGKSSAGAASKSPASTMPPLQAGFGASSRNFKKAVDRNRIKRLTREAYRLQRQALNDRLAEKGRTLALFFIYTGKELPDYATVSEKMGVILQKLIRDLGA